MKNRNLAGIMVVAMQLYGTYLFADPPASTNIAAAIDNYWRQAQFDQCEAYVTNLVNTYSNYLPARVAYITFYLAAYNTDYDVLIQELADLVNTVAAQNDETLDEIKDVLQIELQDRQKQRNVLLNQRGLTIQQIRSERSPTNVWEGNERSWPNLYIIQLSPTNTFP